LATATGVELIDSIRNDLLKSAELTGQWEKKLRMIENGEYQVDAFMEELKVMVNEIAHVVKHSASRTITVEEAPKQEEKPAKRTAKPRERKPKEPVVLKCPKCKTGDILKGKTAWGCSLYKKSCDFLIPLEFEGHKFTQKQIETLVLKGKSGKIALDTNFQLTQV
jgi:DNA topoisomerase-3